MSYIDGFVLAVPKQNKQQYIEVSEQFAVVFKEYGALSVVENWGADVPEGEQTSFPMAVKCKTDEVVVFSWIVWPSKEIRDSGMQKTMDDPRMAEFTPETMPFDGKRMIFGSFETIINR